MSLTCKDIEDTIKELKEIVAGKGESRSTMVV